MGKLPLDTFLRVILERLQSELFRILCANLNYAYTAGL